MRTLRRIVLGVLCLALIVAAEPAAAQITFDSSAAIVVPSGTTASWFHTVGAGSNRLLVVGLVNGTGAGLSATSVTYGGVPLTRQVVGAVAGGPAMEIWTLVAPAAGAAQIVATYAAITEVVAGSVSFAGVDQGTPIRAISPVVGVNAGAAFTITTTVVSSPGDMVIDVAGGALAGFGSLSPAGAGQTLRWNGVAGIFGGSSTALATSASTSMAWTSGVFGAAGVAAMSLTPAPPPLPPPPPGAPAAVPTMSPWTLLLLALAMGGIAIRISRS